MIMINGENCGDNSRYNSRDNSRYSGVVVKSELLHM